MVGVLSGIGGDRSAARVEGVRMRDSTETGGSATELSATDAWHGAAVGDEEYLRLIWDSCEVKFWTEGSEFGQHQRGRYPKKRQLAPASFYRW